LNIEIVGSLSTEDGGKNYRVYSDARRVELDHVPVGAGAMGARVVETEVYRKNVR
jgi:hypothetical protein